MLAEATKSELGTRHCRAPPPGCRSRIGSGNVECEQSLTFVSRLRGSFDKSAGVSSGRRFSFLA
jgi:hypothetical protein